MYNFIYSNATHTKISWIHGEIFFSLFRVKEKSSNICVLQIRIRSPSLFQDGYAFRVDVLLYGNVSHFIFLFDIFAIPRMRPGIYGENKRKGKRFGQADAETFQRESYDMARCPADIRFVWPSVVRCYSWISKTILFCFQIYGPASDSCRLKQESSPIHAQNFQYYPMPMFWKDLIFFEVFLGSPSWVEVELLCINVLAASTRSNCTRFPFGRVCMCMKPWHRHSMILGCSPLFYWNIET